MGSYKWEIQRDSLPLSQRVSVNEEKESISQSKSPSVKGVSTIIKYIICILLSRWRVFVLAKESLPVWNFLKRGQSIKSKQCICNHVLLMKAKDSLLKKLPSPLINVSNTGWSTNQTF